MKKTPANNSAGTSNNPERPRFTKGFPPRLVAFIDNP